MTTFHQIQALGKKTVQMLLRSITGESYNTFPKNYLKQCSMIYQAFKSGNIKALKYVPAMIKNQRYERLEKLENAFAL
jgi:hypothetical protein